MFISIISSRNDLSIIPEDHHHMHLPENCTICGLKCDDRSAFNAHIRAHLKDKLTNLRKLQQQQHNIATSGGRVSIVSIGKIQNRVEICYS